MQYVFKFIYESCGRKLSHIINIINEQIISFHEI